MNETLTAEEYFEEGRIPITVFRMPYVDWSREIHQHDFHEIMIIVGGGGVHHFEGRHEIISMGDVFVVPPHVLHGYEVEENCGIQILNVLFDLQRLRMGLWDVKDIPGFHALFSIQSNSHFEPHLKLNAADLAVVSSIVEEMEEEQEGMVPGADFSKLTNLRRLILFLSRRYSHMTRLVSKSATEMEAVTSHMETHLGDDLDFEDLEAMVDTSPATFRRQFRETYGCAPMVYLQELRIKKAMMLLGDPHKNITDISFEVGFNDQSYFTRVFKKKNGMTPKQFREQL